MEYTHNLILGINPIIAALAIVIIGLTLRLGLGIARKEKKFNVGHVFVSFTIGFFASMPIVATAMHNLPLDITDLELFTMLIGMVGTVVGIDAGVKSAAKKIMHTEIQQDIQQAQDDEELPPGKGLGL